MFTSSTFTLSGKVGTKILHLQLTFWGTSRTKASFSHFPLSLFERSRARKLRFHIFSFQFLKEISHEMRFWEIADARKAVPSGAINHWKHSMFRDFRTYPPRHSIFLEAMTWSPQHNNSSFASNLENKPLKLNFFKKGFSTFILSSGILWQMRM